MSSHKMLTFFSQNKVFTNQNMGLLIKRVCTVHTVHKEKLYNNLKLKIRYPYTIFKGHAYNFSSCPAKA